MVQPSQRAIDLVVECEVSSKSYYEKHYQSPEWPGGASGVTVGIGYDLGYVSRDEMHGDWDSQRPVPMVREMEGCVGVKGDPARVLTARVKSAIVVPWAAAMAVFLQSDVPKWTARVLATLPGSEKLSGDCFGALFSLAYNRGTSWSESGDRYREMRAIKQHLADGRPDLIPAEIRSMKRLWPTVHGLQARRDAEADLFEAGLKQLPAAAAPPLAPVAVKDDPGQQLAPLPPGKKEAASSATGAASAAAANGPTPDAVASWSWVDVALVAGEVALAALIIYLIVRAWRRSKPVLARTKDHPEGAIP
jgi:hypothetical protein